jgi:hypothetical protein
MTDPSNSQFQLDPDIVQAHIQTLRDAGDRFNDQLNQWRNTLQQQDGCWGNDDTGQNFAKQFVPQEQQADQIVDPTHQWFQGVGNMMNKMSSGFQDQDEDNASQISSLDPGDS